MSEALSVAQHQKHPESHQDLLDEQHNCILHHLLQSTMVTSGKWQHHSSTYQIMTTFCCSFPFSFSFSFPFTFTFTFTFTFFHATNCCLSIEFFIGEDCLSVLKHHIRTSRIVITFHFLETMQRLSRFSISCTFQMQHNIPKCWQYLYDKKVTLV